MALEKYQKWTIVSAVFWPLFFVVLFAGVIPRTSIIKEYPCTVKSFSVDPRFDCRTKCPLMSAESMLIDADDVMELDQILEKARELERVERWADMSGEDFTGENIPDDIYENYRDYYYEFTEKEPRRRNPIPSPSPKPDHPDHDRQPHCDDLERDTLKWYSPKLCLKAKWGLEDPLCPNDAVCYTGHNWHRKCHLQCPLAYNITVGLDVGHIGYVEKNRDLGTDADRYNSYKTEYAVGRELTCQIVEGNHKEVKWVEERLSHKALSWWKYSMVIGTISIAVFSTVASIMHYIYRHDPNYSIVPGAGEGDAAEEA